MGDEPWDQELCSLLQMSDCMCEISLEVSWRIPEVSSVRTREPNMASILLMWFEKVGPRKNS